MAKPVVTGDQVRAEAERLCKEYRDGLPPHVSTEAAWEDFVETAAGSLGVEPGFARTLAYAAGATREARALEAMADLHYKAVCQVCGGGLFKTHPDSAWHHTVVNATTRGHEAVPRSETAEPEPERTITVTLTEAETKYVEGVIIDALFDVKRQRNDARSMARQHVDHGGECCFGPARISWQEDLAKAFDEKYQALKSAAGKIEWPS